VLDPFGGAGSTMIACEKTGRQARLIELDPRYVDTMILRWQEFSGGAATLDDGAVGASSRFAPKGEAPQHSAGRPQPSRPSLYEDRLPESSGGYLASFWRGWSWMAS
jgi:hypothetical protein